MSSDASTLAEIASFLSSPRPDVRCEACSSVVAACTVATNIDTLSVRGNIATFLELDVVRTLCRLVSSPLQPLGGSSSEQLSNIKPVWAPRVQKAALEALAQLVGEGGEMSVSASLEAGLLGRVLEVLMEHAAGLAPAPPQATGEAPSLEFGIVSGACVLLANVARSEDGAAALLDKESLFDKLVGEFVLTLNREQAAVSASAKSASKSAVSASSPPPTDAYEHVSTILMNVAQLERGRNYLLKGMHDSLLMKVVPSLRHESAVRRRGAAGAVRNACFEKDSSWWLINEAKITEKILYPLAGPEGFDLDDKVGMDPSLWLEGVDKQRETDEETRMLLVEAILLLCATGRNSRKELRKRQVYPVLHVMDLSEESESVSSKIEECVQFLKRDEAGEERKEEDVQFLSSAEPASSGVIKPADSECYDDVD